MYEAAFSANYMWILILIWIQQPLEFFIDYYNLLYASHNMLAISMQSIYLSIYLSVYLTNLYI